MAYLALGILIIVIAVFLILIVIIQNPKGGMTASMGTIGNQILGASRSTDTVERVTWYLAGGLMILSVASIFLLPDASEVAEASTSEGAKFKEVLDKNKSTTPAFPTAPAIPTPQQAAPQGQPAGQDAPAQTPPQGKN
jgi:preprotein translocase subunit SecG